MFNNISLGDLGLWFVCLLIAMSVHEACHAFAGHALGDTTAKDAGRLTLNPLKHIDLITTIILPTVMIAMHLPPILAAKPVPFNPDRVKYDEFGAALIALAGPASNFVMALLAALILNVVPAASTGVVNFLVLFMSVNIGLFVFNLIPIPPLDGSRVLYAVAPEPVQRVMASIESLGFMAILIVFFLFIGFLSPIIVGIDRSIFNFLIQI